MKRFLSLALSAALLCTLGVPAVAAQTDSADARLAAVTEKVKATLSLDSAVYTSFHGDLEENTVTPTWYLQWSGEETELSVTATEGGKILSYNLMDGRNEITVPSRRGVGASFPKLTRAEAQKTAQAFLDKVLTPGVERAEFGDVGAGGLSATSHNFYGDLLENGLPSPVSFRLSVRVSDNTVTGFSLNGSPENYLGAIPSPTPAADSAKAGESLKATQKLRLEYVLAADGKTATLCYLPEATHDYYVDGQDGKLVDLTELEQSIWERGMSGGEAAPSAAPDTMSKENALSEAEMAGVAQMEGVLSKENLDAVARKITALGLGKYTLSSAAYRVDKEMGDVTATLQYAYKSGDSIYRRTLTVDAKTGGLLSVYSAHPWKEGEKASVSESTAAAKAEAFLKAICPDQFAKTARYGTENTESKSVARSFQYAAKENGYFLPESSITVAIDGTDGSVSAYYNNYVSGVTFQSPEGIIDQNAAQAAWFETYDVTLGYLAVPQKLDLSAPEWKPLIEMGHQYLYTRKLAYFLAREDWYLGIDAKSGEAIQGEIGKKNTVAYTDLNGHWVKAQAEKLADYGVGWLGGTLKPGATLTQLDLVALLVSTDGYRYDPAEENAADRLYNMAYSMGILQKADRNESAEMTRAQLVKLLLDSAGYGNIAGLEGIFQCSFTDRDSISAEAYGYAAVAQGLGLVKGDKAGNFAPNRTATRAEAVSMLYNFMSR